MQVNTKASFTGEEVIDVIKSLSQSQGFYGRLYQAIMNLKSDDPDRYEQYLDHLQTQNFKDEVDVVLYFET